MSLKDELGEVSQSEIKITGGDEQLQVTEETVFQSIRRNPKTVLWCSYALLVLTLSSYDNQAGGIFLSIPQFRKDFGYAFEGNYVLYAKWQSAYTGAPCASAVMGALAASFIADKVGRRPTYLIAFILMLVGITLEVVATTNEVFFGGKFINGFPVGAFGTITVTYLGEVSPKALRGVVTAAAGLSYTLGPFIVTILTNSYGDMNNRWAYRGIFVSQYAVTAAGIIGLPFMPESPIWLVSRGKEEKAARSLKRLDCPAGCTAERIEQMKAILEATRKEAEGATFAECFRRTNLRRTIIGIAPLSIQALCGVLYIIIFFSYYIQIAGYGASLSFKLSIGNTVLSMAGNITSWFLVDRVGRRILTLSGLAVIFAILAISGGLSMRIDDLAYVRGYIALTLLYSYLYNVTIGATAYNLLAEVSTSRLRAKTTSIGLALQSAIYTMFSFVLPYIFDPNEANLQGKTAFIFAGLTLVSWVFLWWYLPETSGRSYAQLDEMFGKRLPVRKFKNFKSEAL